jgi:uncharacterized membrane protein YqjE
MQTEQLKESAGDLAEHISDLAETSYKLAVVNITEKVTTAGAAILAVIILCTLGMFVLLFGFIGLAWWLGDVVENRAAGFAIVAGFFLLLTICLLVARKRIVFPYIRNIFIRKIYE